MSLSLNIASTSMGTQQQRIDTLADNIANVSTHGFKRQRVEFKDAVYSALQNPADPASTANLQQGHGVLAASTTTDFSAGPLLQTGRALDLALVGEGFYAVEGADGAAWYSRDGVFRSQETAPGRHALVTLSGQYALDDQGQRVTALSPLDGLSVDETGRMTLNGQVIGTLGRYSFPNVQALESVGRKTYRANEMAGERTVSDAGIRQGFVEGSNVDLSREMTDLIRAQRAYSLLGRAVQTADQMKATENDIRR